MFLRATDAILVVDIESSSPVDLLKQGMYRYWRHPESRVLMTGYRWLGDRGSTVVDHESTRDPGLPADFTAALRAPPERVLLAAANCEFDRMGLASAGYPTPPEKWIDILELAYILGFSGRLANVLDQTGIGAQKDPRGTHCITHFSKGRHPWSSNIELWSDFLEYCAKDVDVETQLLAFLLPWLERPDILPAVHTLWRQGLTYRRINARGIPVSLSDVHGALAIRDEETEELIERMRRVSDLDNPNSVSQVMRWARDLGLPMNDLRKDTVRDTIALLERREREDPRVPGASKLLEFLRLRQAAGKTSVKKYDALLQATDPDDERLRGGWQFAGASRTRRVAGRILNPANLARPVIDAPERAAALLGRADRRLLQACYPGDSIMDLLSSTLRGCLKAPPGKLWCVADLSSIESIGAAWLAGCDTVLEIFREGRDTYKTFAAAAMDKDYDEVTKPERTLYKPAVLGGAYGLSGPGLVRYADGMGIELSEEDAAAQIAAFRAEYHEIVHYWWQLKSAAIAAVREPGKVFHAAPVKEVLASRTSPNGRTYHEYAYLPPNIRYYCDETSTFLFCRLPSDQYLCYHRPSVEDDVEIPLKDGRSFKTTVLKYHGTEQGATSNQWRKIHTHGGKLLENCTQALCRDILWHGLEQAEMDEGLEVVGDVYDELMTLCDEWDVEALNRLVGYMTDPPPWDDGRLYLAAEGYRSERYRKD